MQHRSEVMPGELAAMGESKEAPCTLMERNIRATAQSDFLGLCEEASALGPVSTLPTPHILRAPQRTWALYDHTHFDNRDGVPLPSTQKTDYRRSSSSSNRCKRQER